MSTFMQDGATWLAGQLQQAAGRSVVYRRGSLSVPLTAWSHGTEHEVKDQCGIEIDVAERVYNIVRDELVVQGQAIEPRPGDTIEETIAGRVERFEVMPLGDTPVSTWNDGDGTMIAVNTKRIKINA